MASCSTGPICTAPAFEVASVKPVLGEVRASVLGEDLRAHELRPVGRSEVVQERRHRVLELDDERRRVRRLVVVDVGEHVGGRRVDLRATLEARLGGGGVDRRAVVELDAATDLERVAGAVVGLGVALGDGRLDVGRVDLVADEPLVHRGGDGVALDLVEDVRIGHLHVGVVRELDHVRLLAGRGCARAAAARLRRAATRGGSDRQEHADGGQAATSGGRFPHEGSFSWYGDVVNGAPSRR